MKIPFPRPSVQGDPRVTPRGVSIPVLQGQMKPKGLSWFTAPSWGFFPWKPPWVPRWNPGRRGARQGGVEPLGWGAAGIPLGSDLCGGRGGPLTQLDFGQTLESFGVPCPI